ncbi:MAG: NAD(P)-dependent oxidoreductase [Bdellovibrionales bacterium]|nr:NAD(P)-dependent oxidoreductase [Bdellovibrionales bacterium]
MRLSSVLVTGSSGFVGSALLSALNACGLRLSGLDLLPPTNPNLEKHFTGSVLDAPLVEKATKGTDAIIHLAAAHKDFGVSREEYFQVNVDGTRTLLEAASSLGVKTFVYFSSVAVYSPNRGTGPITESGETRPTSDYGKSKLAAEEHVVRWAQAATDRQALILRPTNIFGPENHHNLYRLIRTLDKGQFLRVGKLEGIKSIVYIGNVVAATLHLLNRVQPGAKILNLIDEPSMTSWDLVQEICHAGGFKVPRVRVPLSVVLPLGKILDGLAAASGRDFPITGQRIKKLNTPSHFSAQGLLAEGFAAPYSLSQGIRNTVDWYKKTGSKPEAA